MRCRAAPPHIGTGPRPANTAARTPRGAAASPGKRARTRHKLTPKTWGVNRRARTVALPLAAAGEGVHAQAQAPGARKQYAIAPDGLGGEAVLLPMRGRNLPPVGSADPLLLARLAQSCPAPCSRGGIEARWGSAALCVAGERRARRLNSGRQVRSARHSSGRRCTASRRAAGRHAGRPRDRLAPVRRVRGGVFIPEARRGTGSPALWRPGPS